jgi:serine/threonine protein kinase
MSIVKRNIRTGTTPIHVKKTFTYPPSQETLLKAEIAKRYLEKRFENNMTQFERSNEARLKLEKVAESKNLDKQELLKSYAAEENNYKRIQRMKLTSDRFNFLKPIGRGSFGDVWLVMDKTTHEYFAMKVLQKCDIIASSQIPCAQNEREILSMSTNQQWIVKLVYSFQDTDHLYLVMEFVQGGDLMTALIKNDIFPEKTAQFFAGEIALAVNSVHQLGYLHRDLKPDNVLIDINGHIKLTDFGITANYKKNEENLCDLLDENASRMIEGGDQIFAGRSHRPRNSVIGTCDYVAPEVLCGHGNSIMSDWWSFGVVLYEMLYGMTPFAENSIHETAQKIVQYQTTLQFPKTNKVSAHAVDLLKHLLCPAEERYTFEEIKRHPFFNGFSFDEPMLNQPPMVPVVTSPSDTKFFDDIEITQRPSAHVTNLAQIVFTGFSFKARRPSTTAASLGLFS